MARLLFCWELGANFGHLAAIAAMRQGLRSDGHELIFAVADLRAARELLGDGAAILQAPVWPSFAPRGSRNEVASFADVLAPLGFAETSILSPMVDGWLGLIKAIGPDVMIADHSPAAQLGARLARVPIISMGTGFTQPPLDYPAFPPLRADIAPALPEATLLTAAQEVLARRGATQLPASLPSLFRADSRIVIGLPELDPYRPFRRESMCAPPGGYAVPAETPDTARPPHLFAYLGAELPGLEAKIQVLCDLPCPVEIYVRGGDRLLVEFARLRGKIAHAQPVNMREALGRATHVVSQGGAMLASETLAAGLPHLILPLHRETELNATLVLRAAAGRSVDPMASALQFKAGLQGFLADVDLEHRARDAGRVLSERPLPDAGDEIKAALGRLASR